MSVFVCGGALNVSSSIAATNMSSESVTSNAAGETRFFQVDFSRRTPITLPCYTSYQLSKRLFTRVHKHDKGCRHSPLYYLHTSGWMKEEITARSNAASVLKSTQSSAKTKNRNQHKVPLFTVSSFNSETEKKKTERCDFVCASQTTNKNR